MEMVQGIFSFGKSFVQAPAEVKKALGQLEAKLPSARLLISRSEWAMFKDKNLDELILQLRSATYDAEDLLRGFRDQELRQDIEDAGRSRAGQLYASSVNSVTHFLHGSNGRVRETQGKLEEAMAVVDKELDRMGLGVVPEKAMPITTEYSNASQVVGRDTERDQVMEMLGVTLAIDRSDEINKVIKQMGVSASSGTKGKSAELSGPDVGASTPRLAKRLKVNSRSSARPAHGTTNCTSNVSVLPIFGIGGMGKTTLAQLIYNDERVKSHFTVRIWVCVSDLFDEKRMIEELQEQLKIDLPSDLRGLRSELQEHLKIQKFLLVLDDMWDNDKQKWEWEHFYAPLRHGLEGSMILVTTRLEKVARLVATRNCKPVELKGLPDKVFWEFFKQCAFDKEPPESYPHLHVIGQSISSKLCGTPLAAKTLGRLLNSKLTLEYWTTINESELWEQEQNEDEILPALRLSYLHLPYHLRRCFAFCSVFPKDYSFKRDEIVDIWVAEGFVSPQVSKRLEDVGMSYLDQLRDRYLLQTDPKFPNQNRYIMHDLIHDTAQQASMHECFLMKDLNKVVHKVRHMSVKVDGKSLSTSTMAGILHLNTLRSLWFSFSSDVMNTRFSQLPNIMFVSLRGCILEGGLPESICELSSLRYLDISGSQIKELPPKFWSLYSLQFLDATNTRLRTIHQDVTKLTNLRQLALPEHASLALSRVHGLGNLSCLQKLSYYTLVRKNGGFRELKGMNQLRGTLSIKSIHTVRNKEEAAEARLADKKYIEELSLYWRSRNPLSGMPITSENEVIESLRPHERIQRLKVCGFLGDSLPSWLNPNDLNNLRSLELSYCPCLETLPILHFAGGTQGGSRGHQHASSSSTNCSNGIPAPAFTHLTTVNLFFCRALKYIDQFLSPENLPSVESIWLEHCHSLESIPAENFAGFVHLKDLRLYRCSSLVCSPPSQEMILPPSLQRLCIMSCAQIERSFPSCLEKLTSLTVLSLMSCGNIKSIPLDSITCRNKLKFLRLDRCTELSSIGGSGIPSSIDYVKVTYCPKLTQVQQGEIRNALQREEEREIKKFVGLVEIW